MVPGQRLVFLFFLGLLPIYFFNPASYLHALCVLTVQRTLVFGVFLLELFIFILF